MPERAALAQETISNMLTLILLQAAIAATPCQKTNATHDTAAKVSAVLTRGLPVNPAAIRRDERKPCGVETVPRNYRNQIPAPASSVSPKKSDGVSLWD
jgi:hypothetical protein